MQSNTATPLLGRVLLILALALAGAWVAGAVIVTVFDDETGCGGG